MWNEQDIETAERYLNGELTEAQLTEIEKRLETDETFAEKWHQTLEMLTALHDLAEHNPYQERIHTLQADYPFGDENPGGHGSVRKYVALSFAAAAVIVVVVKASPN